MVLFSIFLLMFPICHGEDLLFDRKCSSTQHIEFFDNHLEILMNNGENQLQVSYQWIRDHSRSNDTYNSQSNQRVKSFLEIPKASIPVKHTFNSYQLNVEWDDGSDDKVDLSWLIKSFKDDENGIYEGKELWNKTSITRNMKLIDCKDFLTKKESLIQLFQAINAKGFVLVTECEPTKETTRSVAERVCPLDLSIFGEMWDVEVKDQSKKQMRYDVTDTNGPQEFHTDSTYLTDSNGYQIFHILHAAEQGGDSLLIDGLQVAEKMRLEHPDLFDVLATTEVTWEFIKSSPPYMFHQYTGTTFRLDSLGKIIQIRYNNYHRATMKGINMENIEKFYTAYRLFTEMQNDPANQFWVKLQPGTIMFFDNWRLLHGRSSFKGSRKLTNGWFKRETWENAFRIQKLFET